jgi:hypothetical protein
MNRSPTFDETYNDLVAICKAAQSALYDCGRLRGRNDLTSDEDLMPLVLSSSKAILARLPCLQLENDAISDMDSKYSHLLTLTEDPNAFKNNDFEVTG